MLIVAFFGIGYFNPTVEYGHTITVNKPLKEAWAVTHDETKYDQWLQGFKSMELISGEKGAVGSKYKVVVNPGEGEEDFEMIETIVSLKNYDHVALHFDSEIMEFEQTILFTENDGKVNIQTLSTVHPTGMFLRSMFASMELLTGTFQMQEEKNIDALKVLINENKTTY